MKINPMHSLNAYQKSQQPNQKQSPDSNKPSDALEISSEAKNMAKSAAFQQERSEKVQELKQQVDNGTYQVNAQETARKMYEFWNG